MARASLKLIGPSRKIDISLNYNHCVIYLFIEVLVASLSHRVFRQVPNIDFNQLQVSNPPIIAPHTHAPRGRPKIKKD